MGALDRCLFERGILAPVVTIHVWMARRSKTACLELKKADGHCLMAQGLNAL